MSCAIVTDTNSGILEKEARELGVYIVYMPVIIDGTVYAAGNEISPEDFFEALRTKENISTSQASPGEMKEVWDKVLETYDELVYIPMSGALSSSLQTARVMAEDYNGRVEVADNGRIAITQKQSVIHALKMAKKGKSAAEIRARLEETKADGIIFLSVEELEHLKRGGRITPAVAAIGTLLNIKPLIVIRNDKLDQFAKVRGTKQCRKKELEAIKAEADRYKAEGKKLIYMTAGSFTDPAEAEKWRQEVQAIFPNEHILYDPLSFSVSVHTGINAAGVAICVDYDD